MTQVTDIIGESEVVEFSEQTEEGGVLKIVVLQNDDDPNVLYLDTRGDVDVDLVEWAIGVARDRLLAKDGM
ncbi:hypothetical protein [Pseudofrankia sp. DC12]|uniref:hypothetical protein n=1 Tax=Pseudofrankia sp. DC12 TaxID=683315 RepID=UPI0018DD7F23|nr:hypothetical protein [Pseudofrankia sp. DC12]